MTNLMTNSELQSALRRKFEAAENASGLGLLLRPSKASPSDVRQCAAALGVTFPPDFEHSLLQFDLGRLTLGLVTFCNSGDYLAELQSLNAGGDFPWWGDGPRPNGLLMVALSDPHSILLDVSDGTVTTYGSEESWVDRLCVALNFDLFLRGVGTIFVERYAAADRERLARDIAAACGSDTRSRFWKEITAPSLL